MISRNFLENIIQQTVRQLGKMLGNKQSKSSANKPNPATKKPAHPTPKAAGNYDPQTQAAPFSYAGDFSGKPQLSYAPHADDIADPGEIVWGWIPYEEDHSLGKDRPVLIIGKNDSWLLAVPLSTTDHDLDRVQEERAGRYWIEIGRGPWDTKNRESFVRVNRILQLEPSHLRRIACRLDQERFEKVCQAILTHY